jgi:hypothetical protein
MSNEIVSSNPVVRALIEGTAPLPARQAAARGALPLSAEDLLEVLVHLADDSQTDLSQTARETLRDYDHAFLETHLPICTSSKILSYFAQAETLDAALRTLVLQNSKTPPEAVFNFATKTNEGNLLEVIAYNQQLLIHEPRLIDAILNNPNKTSEAERRALETRREFFEKERGSQQIANELRAQGKIAAAEFIEKAEFASGSLNESDAEELRLIAQMIESGDDEVDDSWLSLEYIEELYEETESDRQAIVDKILGEWRIEGMDVPTERISILNRILKMGMKDRVRLAMKGDREARTILIRDPNRIVAQAVVQNPRITDQEIEAIAAMRTVPEDVLRKIASDRKWSKSYSIVHNLARNPRTPVANVMNILPRLQMKDLDSLSKNKNVSDAVRRQALRLAKARTGK